MTTFDEIMVMKTKYDAAIKQHGKEMLKAHFLKFFEENPTIDAVRWTQYTPYFNDGEACTFGVNEFEFRLKSESEGEDEDEDEDGWTDGSIRVADPSVSWGFRYEQRPEGAAVTALSRIPDDVLEAVFGDHVRVIATRDGFDVNEYSHD